MRIAIKIHVSSFKGLEIGLPQLLTLLAEREVQVSFFFSMELQKKPWYKGLSHQGIDLKSAMLDTLQKGHEIGLLGGIQYKEWIKKAAYANRDWTNHQIAQAVEKFLDLMGFSPDCFAAPGWQSNPYLLSIEEEMFRYASDVRGKFPFYPQLQQVQSKCVQIPVTLPTLKESLNQAEVHKDNVHEYLYAESLHLLPAGHVFQLDAEESLIFFKNIEHLLTMWKKDSSIRPLGQILDEIKNIPVHQIGWAEPEAAKMPIMMQSLPVKS